MPVMKSLFDWRSKLVVIAIGALGVAMAYFGYLPESMINKAAPIIFLYLMGNIAQTEKANEEMKATIRELKRKVDEVHRTLKRE